MRVNDESGRTGACVRGSTLNGTTSHHGRGCDHEYEIALRVVEKTRSFPALTVQLEKARMTLRALPMPSVAVNRRSAKSERGGLRRRPTLAHTTKFLLLRSVMRLAPSSDDGA